MPHCLQSFCSPGLLFFRVVCGDNGVALLGCESIVILLGEVVILLTWTCVSKMPPHTLAQSRKRMKKPETVAIAQAPMANCCNPKHFKYKGADNKSELFWCQYGHEVRGHGKDTALDSARKEVKDRNKRSGMVRNTGKDRLGYKGGKRGAWNHVPTKGPRVGTAGKTNNDREIRSGSEGPMGRIS